MTFSKDASQKIKGIAIIMMIIHHMFLGTDRFAGYDVNFFPFTQDTVIYIAKFFKICVGIYLFITSYGITISLKNKYKDFKMTRKDNVSSILVRYTSLISGFIFIYILSLLASIPFGHYDVYATSSTTQSLVYAIVDALGLADIMGTPILNGTWWYMGLAIVQIILMPLLIKLYNSYGFVLCAIVALVPLRSLGLPSSDLTRWLLCMVLGIWFADKDIFVKLKSIRIKPLDNYPFLNKLIKFIIATTLLVGCVMARQGKLGPTFIDILEGVIPAYVIYYCYEFIIDLPLLKNLFMLIGKYSMTIFLTHTFIRQYYFKDFIYGFKYAGLDFLALLLSSLALAVVIELIKKLVRFDKFQIFLKGKAALLSEKC